MDRRIALTALAGAALAGPALAQTSSSSGTSASGTSSSGGMVSSGSAASPMHQMGQAEMTHMQKTMMGGMFLMETARVGIEKARNAEVKRFAMLETDEQTTISEVLRSMMDPNMAMGGAAMGGAASAGTTSTSASSSSMATPAPAGAPMAAPASGASAMPAGMQAIQMDADKTAMLQKMRTAEAGAAFDRMFLETQLMGHQEALRVQEEYLQSGRNREHVNVAKLARGHIKEHINDVQNIQKEMKG